MKLKKLAGLILLLCNTPAWAIEPFVVKDIRVEGIQRTEAGTVFSYLPVKVGDTLDEEKATEAIKALYATGFFKDVKLKSENGVLIVEVDERPAIAQISINGAKEFEKDKLIEGLKQAGISESRIFVHLGMLFNPAIRSWNFPSGLALDTNIRVKASAISLPFGSRCSK